MTQRTDFFSSFLFPPFFPLSFFLPLFGDALLVLVLLLLVLPQVGGGGGSPLVRSSYYQERTAQQQFKLPTS